MCRLFRSLVVAGFATAQAVIGPAVEAEGLLCRTVASQLPDELPTGRPRRPSPVCRLPAKGYRPQI